MNKFPIKRFGDIAEFINGRAFKPEEWGTAGLPIIRIQNLTGFSNEFNYFDGEFDERYLVKNDDLLISWSASLGVYRWSDGDAVLNQHIFKVNLRNGVDKTFFYYATQTKLREMIGETHGSTMKHITKDRFENLSIVLPPLHIQKQIAAILEKADAAREKRRQANKLTEQFLQSAFLEMFRDGTHERAKLRDVCRIITDGTHITPKYLTQGVPFVSVKDVRSKRIDFSDVKYISQEEHRFITKRCRPERGDILYTKVGATFGNAVVVDVDIEFSIFVSLALLKPKFDIIDPTFLKYMMNTDFVKSQARQRVRGIAVPDLHLVEIKDFNIYLPSMHEQKKFLALAEKVESLRAKQRESEKELENLFDALMQRAFRGELVS
jgi:type I restriction enzyme, S subunit